MTFGYPRVPAGFTLGLGPSRAWPVSKTSGSGTRKNAKKRLGRARARVGLRPVPPLLLTVMGANDAENCDNYLGS